jgi:chemotaxis signal transduction protein
MKDKGTTACETGSYRVEREGKYLTFCLEDEEYGIGILNVKEIISIMWRSAESSGLFSRPL